MSILFGANSGFPATQVLTNGYRLYDWVMRNNSFPCFWGRGILSEHPLTQPEISFLRDNNCRIMLTVNDLKEAWISSDDPDEGREDALRAAEAADKLKVPQNQGIALFAEFHSNWEMTSGWMQGYAQTIADSGYIPGFICNTDSAVFNTDCDFTNMLKSGQQRIVFCSVSPECNREPEEWLPGRTGRISEENVLLWRTGITELGDFWADRIYAKNHSVLNCMWQIK